MVERQRLAVDGTVVGRKPPAAGWHSNRDLWVPSAVVGQNEVSRPEASEGAALRYSSIPAARGSSAATHQPAGGWGGRGGRHTSSYLKNDRQVALLILRYVHVLCRGKEVDLRSPPAPCSFRGVRRAAEHAPGS